MKVSRPVKRLGQSQVGLAVFSLPRLPIKVMQQPRNYQREKWGEEALKRGYVVCICPGPFVEGVREISRVTAEQVISHWLVAVDGTKPRRRTDLSLASALVFSSRNEIRSKTFGWNRLFTLCSLNFLRALEWPGHHFPATALHYSLVPMCQVEFRPMARHSEHGTFG
jgi:hypothetical protein